MVEFNSLKELLDLFPNFIDRTPSNDEELGSVHYRVQEVRNNQYKDLRSSINLLGYSNNINRPLIISKTQNKAKEYSITCTVNIPHLKKISVHKINPKLQSEVLDEDSGIFYTKSFTQEEDLDYYTVTFNETSTTTIPLYQYILTVETWDEYYYAKGYPENDNNHPTILFINTTTKDDGTKEYNIINDDLLDEISVDEYDEDYFRFIDTYKVSKDHYPNTENEIIVYRKEIEDHTTDGIVYHPWEQVNLETEEIQLTNDDNEKVTYTSYKVKYNPDYIYSIIKTAPDNYFTIDYYPFTYTHDYEIFQHDNTLDVIGAKLNIPRWQHTQVLDPSRLDDTEPSYFNRFEEDDAHYSNRISTYIGNYGEKYLPELELWKRYGLPSVLTNRKDVIASQCDSYMWTDCCTDTDNVVKNKTSIVLVTKDLKAYYTVPKSIKVRVTCEDNEAVYDVLDGFVEYRFNGENHYARVQNGYATLVYTPSLEDWGTSELQIQYTGFDEYDESNTITTSIDFDGKPINLNLDANNYTATHGDYINLKAEVSYDDELIGGVVEFYWKGNLLTSGELENNKVNIRYKVEDKISIGVQDITVIYHDTTENPEYATTSKNLKLNVLGQKQDTHISSYVFYQHGFAFHLYSEENIRIADRILYIYEGNKQIGSVKTNANYFAVYYYNDFQFDLNKKYYVEFKGDATYKPCRYRIYPVPTPLYKDTHFVTVVNNNHIGFKLHDGRDNTLWDMSVTAEYNGTLIDNYTTMHDWIWIDLETFDYDDIVTLTYDGNGDYEPCTVDVSLNAPTSDNDTYWYINNEYITEKGKTINVTGQLLNNDNEPLVDFPVRVYHRENILDDRLILTEYTDESGCVRVDFTPTSDINPQYLRFVFDGNPSFKRSSSLVRVRVGAGIETRITGELNDNSEYKCRDTVTLQLTDVDGLPLKDKTVNLCEHTSRVDTGTGEDIGEDNIFSTGKTDSDGFVNIRLEHSYGTFDLSATFDGDDVYKKSRLLLGTITLIKRNLCMTTYPSRDGVLHKGSNINTRVYDCVSDEGLNGMEVTYYFQRLSTGASQELAPVTTSRNTLEQDGYAYQQINYSDGDYIVGVTITDPSNKYNSKSTVYSNITNKVHWNDDKYLYPIHITSEGKIQTSIQLSTDTITSGENVVATLLDETGNPLSGKIVYFRNADGDTFATAITDNYGHATKQFNMAEVKNKVMYYGWESDNDLYESVENVAHISINRRSLCFVENNINGNVTIPVGYTYRNRLVDCRDYADGLVDRADYTRSMEGKIVSIIFERFSSVTGESLGRSAPYYIRIDNPKGRFTFPINLAPSGANGDYHYTFELNYDYDLDDKDFKNNDGYYNDKQTYPIKFFTEAVDVETPTIDVSTTTEEVVSGGYYEVTARLPSDAEGTVIFVTSNGGRLNSDEPVLVRNGIATYTGTVTANQGQTFNVGAEFTSTNYAKYNSSKQSSYAVITVIAPNEQSTKTQTTTTFNSVTPSSGQVGDTFTANVNVKTSLTNANVTDGTVNIVGFGGKIIGEGTVSNGTSNITCTVPTVNLGQWTDLTAEYKGSETYLSSISTDNRGFIVVDENGNTSQDPIPPTSYTFTSTLSNGEVTVSENVLVNCTVKGKASRGNPTGTVTLQYKPYWDDDADWTSVTSQTLTSVNGSDTDSSTTFSFRITNPNYYRIRTHYEGDNNYENSGYNYNDVYVDSTGYTQATPTLTLNSVSTANKGTDFTVTATVTGTNSNGTPIGHINWTRKGSFLKNTPVSGSGNTASATITLNESDTGSCKIGATFMSYDLGKYNHNGAFVYKTVTITDNSSSGGGSSISNTTPSVNITNIPSSASYGGTINVTASVTGDSTRGTPTGSMELYVNNIKASTVNVSGTGTTATATFSNVSINGLKDSISVYVKYNGGGYYNSKTSSTSSVTVNSVTPSVSLSGFNSNVSICDTGTVTAVVTPADALNWGTLSIVDSKGHTWSNGDTFTANKNYLGSNTFTATFTSSDTGRYNNATGSKQCNVSKRSVGTFSIEHTSGTKVGETLKLKIKCYTPNGCVNFDDTGTVKLYLTNTSNLKQSWNTSDTGGTKEYTQQITSTGSFKFIAVYSGDSSYNSSQQEITINITQ